MTVVLATIATLFLMMPGFAFIAGVNITDKNIREIVFRGTPAELAYVVAISLLVHCVFAEIAWGGLSPATLADWYTHATAAASVQAKAPALPSDIPGLAIIVVRSLLYFVVSSLVGLELGFVLGGAVRRWPDRMKLFAKHRWMLGLVGVRDGDAVFARALTSPKFPQPKGPADEAIIIQGMIRDCFFNADGTLLYLVFNDFKETKANL